jgi:hypothetical protein
MTTYHSDFVFFFPKHVSQFKEGSFRKKKSSKDGCGAAGKDCEPLPAFNKPVRKIRRTESGFHPNLVDFSAKLDRNQLNFKIWTRLILANLVDIW